MTSFVTRLLRGRNTRCSLIAVVLGLALSSPAWAGTKKTYFTTRIASMTTEDPGKLATDGSRMYMREAKCSYVEEASDPRINGPAAVEGNAILDLLTTAGAIWGTAVRERGNGAWQCVWGGTRTVFKDENGNPHARSTILETAIGRGSLAGLVARWTISAVDADQGNPFEGDGYIVEARGGPGDRPMQSRSAGTEWVEIHPVRVLPPSDPPVFYPPATSEILSEVLQVSRLGRSSNGGPGMLALRAAS